MAYDEIKYALNSKLGNADFQALDILIDKWFERGFVKSVQRGVIDDYGNCTVNIQPVNPNKCVVIMNNAGASGFESPSDREDNSFEFKDNYIVSLTSNSLTIYNAYDSYKDSYSGRSYYTYSKCSWQVIEFY